MKKIISGVALSLIATAAMAQETYESAQLSTEDLNGTARYIGMGGAMEALGADISTMTSNPAGIGMFRKSWAGISAGATFQKGDDTGYYGKSSTANADLNQVGFVYVTRPHSDSYFNLGFNFTKSRNFNQIMKAVNSLDDASVNKASYIAFYNRLPLNSDAWVDYGDDARWDYASDLEELNSNAIASTIGGYSSSNAYYTKHDKSGYIGNYDFNVSGNIHNKLFLGLSVGIKDVHYNSEITYSEDLVDLNNDNRGTYDMYDQRRITGVGYNVKFGAIYRPIESSGFRIGAYIHTPTWYNLSCDNYKEVSANLTDISVSNSVNNNIKSYDYKIVTPWKFGVSLGQTIGSMVAIGATYEFADYSSIKNKRIDGTYTNYEGYEDWYGGYGYYDTYTMYSDDNAMDRNTDMCLKGVNTLKLGVEVKPVPEVAIRMGYNWVSPMYDEDGSKDLTIDNLNCDGAYLSTYDYTNWKDTHRITFGLGFKLSERINLDLAYQFSTQKGEYHPFQSLVNCPTYELVEGEAQYDTYSETNIGTPSTVKNNRHQISCTLGVRL